MQRQSVYIVKFLITVMLIVEFCYTLNNWDRYFAISKDGYF